MWQIIIGYSKKPFSIEITIYELPHAAPYRKAVEKCSAYDLPVANRDRRKQNIKGRCPESEENMNHKFYYGSDPTFTDADREDFSRGGYECKALMKDGKGQPVAISQNTDPDFPVWKVEYGYSCVIFATYDEAMAFCKGRFSK